MTSLNINISRESVVKLALAANEQDVTLKQYICDILDGHANKLTTNYKSKASTTKPPPEVKIHDVDLDEEKKLAKETASTNTNKKSTSTPLYGKKESNTWKIW